MSRLKTVLMWGYLYTVTLLASMMTVALLHVFLDDRIELEPFNTTIIFVGHWIVVFHIFRTRKGYRP